MRTTEAIIEDIKDLVNSGGYIYALSMVLFEDFHINLEKMHEMDWSKKLNTNEASLLLGFLIQDCINFSIPKTPQDLIHLKQKTYELMEELHKSFLIAFFDKLKKSSAKYLILSWLSS